MVKCTSCKPCIHVYVYLQDLYDEMVLKSHKNTFMSLGDQIDSFWTWKSVTRTIYIFDGGTLMGLSYPNISL